MSQVNHSTTTYVDINDTVDQARQNDFAGPKKGNFLYNKCYVCISIFKWFPVLFIFAILIWSYYAYVLQLCLCKFFFCLKKQNPMTKHNSILSTKQPPNHRARRKLPSLHADAEQSVLAYSGCHLN